jgi:hypothetical protein
MTRSNRPIVLTVLLAAACEPELSDVPFSCGSEGICPDGYTCQATVCVREGATLEASRPMRISWINAGEMYWFASPGGGATLVVNDGFTEGSRGLYEIAVGADGAVGDPSLLLDFGEEFATSSAVVALDDDHYGVLTLAFPSLSSTFQSIQFWSVPREGRGGSAQLVAEPSAPPFVGGAEPVYVGAVARKGGVDVSFADPSAGGQVVVGRIEGSTFTERARLPIGNGLPLSGDSLIWDLGDSIAIRIGLEESELWRIPDGTSPVPEGPITFEGQPVYAFSDRIFVLSTTEEGESIAASLDAYDWTGAMLGQKQSFVLQPDLEPFAGVPSGEVALLAPLADDDAFSSLQVAQLGRDGNVARIATIERPGDDSLYSARALASGGRVYLAWTSFHESLMDLWIGVADGGPQ